MDTILRSVSLFILTVFTVNEHISVFAQRTCYTPYGYIGRCVPMENCNAERNNMWEKNYIICEGDNWNQLNICCEMSNLKQRDERPFWFTSSNKNRKQLQDTTKQQENQLSFKDAGFNFNRENDVRETRPSWSQRRETKSPAVLKETRRIWNQPQIPEATEIANGLNSEGLRILNSMGKCGYISGRLIAGGEKAKLAEFPWMALLKYTGNIEFQCGGTLITNRYVLTAAHCVVATKNKLIGVRLGEHVIGTEKDCIGHGNKQTCYTHRDFGIDKIISNPSYSRSTLLNDIALIKLDRDVPDVANIKPICLPITETSKKPTVANTYLIAGWGITEENTSSKTLLKAKVNSISQDTCKKTYTRFPFTDSHLCAGSFGSSNTCQGDSGGPLFFLAPYKGNKRYVQYGVVSLGSTKCGEDPSIFTNIIELLPWITNNID